MVCLKKVFDGKQQKRSIVNNNFRFERSSFRKNLFVKFNNLKLCILNHLPHARQHPYQMRDCKTAHNAYCQYNPKAHKRRYGHLFRNKG